METSYVVYKGACPMSLKLVRAMFPAAHLHQCGCHDGSFGRDDYRSVIRAFGAILAFEMVGPFGVGRALIERIGDDGERLFGAVKFPFGKVPGAGSLETSALSHRLLHSRIAALWKGVAWFRDIEGALSFLEQPRFGDSQHDAGVAFVQRAKVGLEVHESAESFEYPDILAESEE